VEGRFTHLFIGNNRAARVSWHDKETGLISDVPSESRLFTDRFGDIEWR